MQEINEKNEKANPEACPQKGTPLNDQTPVFGIQTPFGEVSIDMKAYSDAKTAAYELMPKKERTNLFDSKMFTFLNAIKTQRDSRYWKGHLGALMKMHLDSYLEPEY
ncbi:MAG: hypothetical protein HOH94_09795, partial [Verrucomicrobia bacterium]|nr:hypothetical protein [Verrucomicrobiota bacterium]